MQCSIGCVVQHVYWLANGVGCAKMIDSDGECQVFGSVCEGLKAVKGRRKAWTKGQKTEERTMCGSHWAHEEKEYMDDGDSVSQVKEEEEDGVIALWRRLDTHLYG